MKRNFNYPVINRNTVLLLTAILIAFAACNRHRIESKPSIDDQVDSLLSLMTLEEKIGQLTLYTSDYDITGPSIREGYKDDIKSGSVGAIFNAYGADYTRQLQEMAVKETRLHIPLLFGYDVIHGHKTIFPVPLGEASSWDMAAINNSARIAGDEASAQGLHWTFAPMCDVARDPRWGRMVEGAGEDTYLGSRIAAALVKGFQGDGIGSLNSVMACVKHFAAYGAVQGGRDYNTVDMSDRMLRETYLPPYKAAIDAGAATVMTSFNELDGVPATSNKFLMTDVLRNEWGFGGFVVTDYTSIMEMIPHGVAEDTASAAALALEAGVDMDMQSGFYQDALPGLIKQGIIKEELINTSVKRILRKKFELGLFKNPYRYSDVNREKATIMKVEFLEAARDMAKRSIVLLKNEVPAGKQVKLLPLSKTQGKIAVIGPLAHARKEMIGSWSAAGDWSKAVTLLEGIQSKVGVTNHILYAKGCNINDDSTQYLAEAIRIAKQVDVVVLAVGEAAAMSGEAASRAALDLPGIQQRLVEEIQKTGKPVVVVLMNGRPLTINWIDENIPAVLETWFSGTQGGHAIADVLFGDYNPSGKLPVTFPRSVGQIPIFYSMKNTGRPMNPTSKYTSKYLDESNDPLYPFGYGLSYTTFNYGDVMLNKKQLTPAPNDEIVVTCKITNTGSCTGEEVVQLYIQDLVGSVTRPVKELKGFEKVVLQKGESKNVVFRLTTKDLSFLKLDKTFGAEPGKFKVMVGGDSNNVKTCEFDFREPLTTLLNLLRMGEGLRMR